MDDLRHTYAQWSKSSYSNANGACVGVDQNLTGIVAIRDSKVPVGAKLLISPAVWRAFIHGLKRVLCL